MRIADAYRRGNRFWLILDHDDGRPSQSKEFSLEEILIKASERKVSTVSIDAGNPGMWTEDLLELLKGLKRMGKNVELSMSPLVPGLVERTLGMVGSYILDCDPEGSEEDFLSNPELHHNLAKLMGKNVIIRKTIDNDGPSLENIVRLGEAVASVAKTAVLHQQGMGSVHGIDGSALMADAASEDMMLKLGRALSYHVPHVILRGEGFRVELNRH